MEASNVELSGNLLRVTLLQTPEASIEVHQLIGTLLLADTHGEYAIAIPGVDLSRLAFDTPDS